MKQGRSSSNRAATLQNAAVWNDQQPLGPIRLPSHRVDEFIADFARIYRGLGLVVRDHASLAQRKIPGNSFIAGDFIRENQDQSAE